MTDIIRTWVMTLTGTALITSMAIAIAPDGETKKTVRFVSGIAVLIAVLSLVKSFDVSDFSKNLAEYRIMSDGVAEKAQIASNKETRAVIEQKCAAYILDKAAHHGVNTMECRVTAKWSTDGYWYPVSADITADIQAETRSRLIAVIESDLGIPEKNQNWGTYEKAR